MIIFLSTILSVAFRTRPCWLPSVVLHWTHRCHRSATTLKFTTSEVNKHWSFCSSTVLLVIMWVLHIQLNIGTDQAHGKQTPPPAGQCAKDWSETARMQQGVQRTDPASTLQTLILIKYLGTTLEQAWSTEPPRCKPHDTKSLLPTYECQTPRDTPDVSCPCPDRSNLV